MNLIIRSAGVVIFRFDPPEPRCLLLRAYRNWDFPKGVIDAGETPLEAARREVREETGLTGLEFRWGEEFVETGPYGRGKIARYYLAATTESRVVLLPNPLLGRPEHDAFRWVTCAQAGRLVTPRLQPVLRWGCAKVSQPPPEPPAAGTGRG